MQKALLLSFLPIILLSQAQATTFNPRPFPETIQGAPIIVRGRIGGSHVQWATGFGSQKALFTYTELILDEVLKGTPLSGLINVRAPGGEKDGVGMRVPGSPQFRKGEEVVLLLSPVNSDGSYDVKGLETGKYELKRETISGEEYVQGGVLAFWPNAGRTDTDEKWTLRKIRNLIRDQQATQGVEKTDNSEAAAQGEGAKKPPISSASPLQSLKAQGGKESGPLADMDGASRKEANDPQENESHVKLIIAVLGILLLVGVAWFRGRGRR